MSDIVWFGLLVTSLLVLGGFFIRNSKVYLAIQIIWVLILLVGNTNSMDFFGNESLYLSATPENISREGIFMGGYYYLSIISKKIGLSYIQFNGICAIAATLIITYIVLKLSSNPCTTYSFFMLYPLASSIIQKRWYIAMGILVLGVSILLLWNKKSKFNISILYTFMIFLACQIHTGAIFFFTLIIFYWLPDKVKPKVAIIGLFLMSIMKNQLKILFDSSSNVSLSGKAEFYFGTLASDNVWHYAFWIVWQLLFVIFIFYLLSKNNIRKIWGENLSHFLWIINWWSILIIPLYSFDPVFTRLFRVVLIFNYIAIANLLIFNKNRIMNNYKIAINIYQLALCLASFIIFNALAGAPFDQLIYPIFENNIFLSVF